MAQFDLDNLYVYRFYNDLFERKHLFSDNIMFCFAWLVNWWDSMYITMCNHLILSLLYRKRINKLKKKSKQLKFIFIDSN